MKWYKNLYVGDSIGKKFKRIKWKINHNAGTINIFVISLSSTEGNILDIIPAIELLQKGYPKKEMYIVGLAGGYDEAVELVQEIIQQTYDDTGAVDVKNYLLSKGGSAS